MSVSFDKKDGNVVVVIGTGPGGGVLASELAQKGVKVVALEAGGRHGPEDFVNDEWASFGQPVDVWKLARCKGFLWIAFMDC